MIIDLKKYLERCIAHGSLNLTHIDKIEERLLEDYGFPTFAAMGFGRFLQFLIHEAKQVMLHRVKVQLNFIHNYICIM